MEMKKLEHDLLTEKYTKVFREDNYKFNAPHHFLVVKADAEIKDSYYPEAKDVLAKIDFQEGPIKENGVNGVCNEDLICMVIARLQGFQASEFSCRENALALTALEEALLWLRKRTMGREKRGVEGKSIK
jgi:hypothetical protein